MERQPSWSADNESREEGGACIFPEPIPQAMNQILRTSEPLVQGSHTQKSMWARQVTEMRQTSVRHRDTVTTANWKEHPQKSGSYSAPANCPINFIVRSSDFPERPRSGFLDGS